jgi:translation initiation factor eIF-2B subunit epsilon
LNYTIEFLASSGVREVFVLCKAHADALEAHIKSLKGKIGVEVHCLKAIRSTNLGDALRMVAEEELLTQDFVLVYGDIVSNQKLLPIIQEHVMRREKDKTVLMTLLLTKVNEDPELAKLKIPLLNTLFSGSTGSQQHQALGASAPPSATPSTTVTPHISSLLPHEPIEFGDGAPISSNIANADLSSSSASSSSTSRAVRAASVSASSALPLLGSSSPGHSSYLESVYASTHGAASNLSASASGERSGSVQQSTGQKLGESSVYLTLSSNESKLVIMDDETGQVYCYDDRASTHSTPHVELDPALFRKHRFITVRNDLQDSGVAVCSPDVLVKFTDHFDYKNLSQLVRGVINDELQELKVYAAVADPSYYTQRVSSLRRYHQVNMDVMKRWAFPLVPDANILPDSSWSYFRPGYYKEQHVHLHRDCKVNNNCAIGAESSLAAGVVVSHSTIGRRCKIGRNVKISHSFIWDNVTIEDDVVLDHAIVCSGAFIGQGSMVSAGSIVSFNVKIGGGVTLPPLTKLSAFGLSSPEEKKDKEDDDFGDSYSSDEDDDGYSSEDHKDHKKERKPEENLREIDLGGGADSAVGRKWNLPPLPFNELYTGWETINHVREVLAAMQKARGGSEASAVSGATGAAGAGAAGAEDAEPTTDLEAFSKEVDSIVSSYCKDSKKQIAQLILEVNALKFAHDRSFLDCMVSIFASLLNQVDASAIMKSLIVNMKRFKPVFPAFLYSTEDEKEFIFALEEHCDKDGNELIAKQFTNILNKLYELEIIKEQAFLDWAEEHEADEEDEDDEEEASELYNSAKSFIDWLKDADEEEEEEDEEDDDDE